MSRAGCSAWASLRSIIHRDAFRFVHNRTAPHRAPGAIGQRQTPGRVFPGKRMAGRLGADKVTKINLEVVKIDAERNLLLVKGAVPGSENGQLVVRPAIKAKAKATAKPAAKPAAKK